MKATVFGLFALALTAGASAAAASAGASADGSATAPSSLVRTESGPDVRSPLASFSYYYILGSALRPRSSTSTFAYSSNGCAYQSGGADLRWQFPLLLPEGSIVKYVRIYYLDSGATDLTVWLTRYDAGTSNLDLTSVLSSGAAGYGSALSVELTETFDSALNYTLTFGPGVANSTNQLCGVRVAYYAPLIFRDGFETGDTTRWSAVVP